MRYSDMSEEQRRVLLEDPANYPLRVRFMGKRGLLMPDAIVLLRQNEIDFEVDDVQIENILAERVGAPTTFWIVASIYHALSSLRRILAFSTRKNGL